MKRPKTKNFTVRLTDEERMWLEKEAKAQMRSVGNLISYVLSQYRQHQKGISPGSLGFEAEDCNGISNN